jgi:hypothetical protein
LWDLREGARIFAPVSHVQNMFSIAEPEG